MELDNIKKIIAEVKNIDEKEINEDMDFINDLHLDSIEIFQIIMGLEDIYKTKIDNEKILSIKTVKDAVDIIKSMKNEK